MIASFHLGANLRKSANSNWYANSAMPASVSSFGDFIYVNGNTGKVACGTIMLERMGGSWSDGKWYKTFDLVLRTNKTGGGSTVAAKKTPKPSASDSQSGFPETHGSYPREKRLRPQLAQ